jgi:hypothetical protein
MKRIIVAITCGLLAVGCKKKSDSPPPPPDTANVAGTWVGPFTYTYPVTGGPVTSVTVTGNMSMVLSQDGLGVTGTYADSTGGSGTVTGNVQNHTFRGSLSFTPVGLVVSVNVTGTSMSATVVNGGISGHGTFTRSASPSIVGLW